MKSKLKMINYILERMGINIFLFCRHFLTMLILTGIAVKAAGQNENSAYKVSILPLPTIGYSPETSTYLGAVTLFTFRDTHDFLTRTSNAKIKFTYTWNKQVIIESDWNYFFPEEKWFTRGILHYSKYPDLYYGIGFNTPDEGEEIFQSNRHIFDVDLLRQIQKNWFFGSGINYNNYSNVENQSDNISYPELENESNLGLKAILLSDSRNNILSPSEGKYFEFINSFNFSSSFYYKTLLDYRRYFEWGELNKHVLAGRLYHSSIIGTPPFYDFNMIGGDQFTRGYYLGRFRDKNFSTLQIEYRSSFLWRFGLAAFGGVSMIADRFQNIDNENIKPNAGVGLRFLIDKNESTSLRIDYAIGVQNQSGFYISFGESF